MLMFPFFLAPVHLPTFFYLALLLRRPEPVVRDSGGRKIRVSILIPCRNEAEVIGDTIRSILDATQNLDREIIVVDDASTDNTYEVASRFASAGVKVVRKEYGGNGKAEAINFGLRHCTGDVVVVFDADSRPERDAIVKLLPHLGGDVVGCCGMVKVENKDENWLTRLASFEFTIANYIQYKKSYSRYFSPLLTGTLMALDRRYASFPKSLVEDALLSAQLIRAGKEIVVEPSAVSRQLEPPSLRVYFRQRTRWARGNWGLLRFWGRGRKSLNSLMMLSERVQPVFTVGSWALLAYSVGSGYGAAGMLEWPTIILTALFAFTLVTLGTLIHRAVRFSREKYPATTYILYFTVYQFIYLAIWLRSLFPVRTWYRTPHQNSGALRAGP